jgi:hypothetical protein
MTEGQFLSRREFLKRIAAISASATVVSMAGVGGTVLLERGWLDVNPQTVVLPNLAPEFAGYRIVHFSDIHMDDWMTAARLAGIVETINAQQPDLIAFTGDLVTRHIDRYAADLVTTLSQLSARDGVVAVLGNHDHWTDATMARRILHAAGIQALDNAVHTVRRGAGTLHVGGVDDYWQQQARLDQVLDDLPDEGAAILLAHEPDFADVTAASGRFDLQLSGHTHGGQVCWPLVGPLVLPRYGRKYPLGRYQVGAMIQYTNRGVGMVQPQVRLNCRPEVTVFTLQGA